jgi:hypothetical protein
MDFIYAKNAKVCHSRFKICSTLVRNFGLKSLERLVNLRGNKTMIRFTESYCELSTNGGDV